jgi:hypothetical protein
MTASVKALLEKANEHKVALAGAAGVSVAALLALRAYRRAQLTPPSSGPYPAESLPTGAYDAVIVGAGPSGSVCGYYMAQGGAKVAVLEVSVDLEEAGQRFTGAIRRPQLRSAGFA